jgi:hypothetical protein
MVLNKLRERRLMHLRQYVAELGRFGFAGCERGPTDPAQRADEGIAVLPADFPVLVAMAVIDAHGKSCQAAESKR